MTDNVCGVLLEYLVILLQNNLQSSIILGLSLFNQPLEGHHPLVVIPEAIDEAFETLVGRLLIPCPQT